MQLVLVRCFAEMLTMPVMFCFALLQLVLLVAVVVTGAELTCCLLCFLFCAEGQQPVLTIGEASAADEPDGSATNRGGECFDSQTRNTLW